jgi:hypothetical protein
MCSTSRPVGQVHVRVVRLVLTTARRKEMLHHLCFTLRHQDGPRKQTGTETEWDTSASGLC